MNKKRDILSLLLAFIILILMNFLGSFIFHRFDLTSEKRYTLSDVTKKILGDLNDVVYVKVYLEGEFPAGFKRLSNETKEMLDEFRAFSNDNIEYQFINPSLSADKKEQNDIYKQLYEKLNSDDIQKSTYVIAIRFLRRRQYIKYLVEFDLK